MSFKSIAAEIRVVSLICFWLQLVLAGVPIIWLLISAVIRSAKPSPVMFTLGSSCVLGLLSLAALLLSIGWWYKHQRIARRIPDPETRPRHADVVRSLRTGFIVNLIGISLVTIAALSYGWMLMIRVMMIPQGAVLLQQTTSAGKPAFTQLDALIILAIVHTIAAGLAGIVGYVWLLKRLSDRPKYDLELR